MIKSNEKSPYFISFDTFLLQPVFNENRMGTLIIERHKELTSPRKPIHIVRRACSDYGNSFKGVTHSSKLMLKKSHKVPIVIAHDLGKPFVFLPTMSPISEHNIWIALHAIENIEADKLGCIVYLENQYSVKINVSEATIHRQYTLGSILKKKYQNKFRQLHRTTPSNHFDFS